MSDRGLDTEMKRNGVRGKKRVEETEESVKWFGV